MIGRWCPWMGALLAVVLGAMPGCRNSFSGEGPNYSRTPVLLVHGSGLTSDSWVEMKRGLLREGYPRDFLLSVDIVPNHMSNPKAASLVLAPAVERLLDRAAGAIRRGGYNLTPPRRVDIIGHSMGAVSSRWYAAKLRPDRVRTLVALTGSNHGTDALKGHAGEGNREMVPAFAASARQSEVQVSLNGTPTDPIDETPYGLGTDRPGVASLRPDAARNVLYLTVRLDPDEWIKPASSALLDGAGGTQLRLPRGMPMRETSPGNYLYVGTVAHDFLPAQRDVIRFVALSLNRSGGPTDTK